MVTNNIQMAFGALKPKKDIREFKAITNKAAQVVDIPDEFELTMPPVKSQGQVGSCVAHSISLAIEYYNKLQEETDITFSTGYIYGNRRNQRGHNGSGMYVDAALSAVVKWGDVAKDKFSENIEVPEAITLFEERAFDLAPEAYPNRFTEYFALKSDEQIKLNLMQNGPVVFSIPWYKDYAVEAKTYILKHTNNATSGGHCMVIYGWNKDGWKFQNSWGTSWGNRGRAILPYGTKMSTCYGIKDTIMARAHEKQLAELKEKLEKLTENLENKEKELQKTIEKLKVLDKNNAEQAEELQELKESKTALTKEINSLQKQIKELQIQNEQLESLRAELFAIKKPFEKMPKWLVKIINAILNLFN